MKDNPTETWRVLLVDDDEEDYRLTHSMLSAARGRKISLDWAATYDKGRELLLSNLYQAVLIDYDLGAHTGVDLIREMAAQGYPAPLILYTGQGSYETDLEAMQAGATLYMTKTEATPHALERSLRYAIERRQMEAELQAKKQELAVVNEQLEEVNEELLAAIEELQKTTDQAAWLARFPEENPNPVLRVSDTGRILYSNSAAQNLAGWRCEAGKPIQPSIVPSIRQALAQGKELVQEIELAGNFYSISIMPFPGEGYVNLYVRDISLRKAEEKQLNKLNRTLIAFGKSIQAMLRAESEAEYLQEVCRIITADCGYAMVWIGFAEQDESMSVRPAAFAGFETGYLETLHITWADNERGRGPTGTAIRTGKPALCRNMLSDPQFTPWRSEALKRGYASSLVLPLMDNQSEDSLIDSGCHRAAFGALTIYSREQDAFSEDEIGLLTELANDLAYGISALRLRQHHAWAEAKLLESQHRLSTIVDSIADGFYALDGELRFTHINDTALRYFGKAREEMLGRTLLEVFPEATGSPFETGFHQAIESSSPVHFLTPSLVTGGMVEMHAYPGIENLTVLFRDVTEQYRMQAALRESEERYRSLFNGMTEGFAVHEVITDEAGTPCDYRFLDINPAFEQLTGLKREDVIGKTLNEVLPGENPIWVQTFGQVALTGEPVHFDSNSPILNRHYEVYAYRPAPRQFATVFKDITGRKQAEEDLRQRAEEIEKLMNLVPAAIWVSHDPGCYQITGNQVANQFYEAMEGENVSAGPEPGRTVGPRRFFYNGRELRADELPMQEASARNADVRDAEFDVLLPSGKWRTLWGSATPLRDSEGQVRGCIAAFMDITEHKLAEGSVRWQNSLLSGINRIFREAISSETEEELGRVCLDVAEEITHSKFGFICEINSEQGQLDNIAISDPGWEACRMQEPVGHGKKTPLRFKIHGIYGRVLLEGKGFFTNDPASHPDRIGVPAGHPALESFLGVPLIHNGKTIGMVGLGNREGGYTPEVLEAAEILAPAIVQALMSKRAEEALREYAEKLESSNRALQDFAFIASHDLREPLRKVQTFGNMLATSYISGLDEQGQDYVRRMQAAAERMQDMLDGLMEYSRVTTQGRPFEMVDLNQAAQDALSNLEVRLAETGGQVELGELPTIEADPIQMRQLLQNLIANALKFHQEGVAPVVKIYQGSWISDQGLGTRVNQAEPIHQSQVTSHQSLITIHFADNGIGFDMDEAKQLFQPFHRLVGRSEYDGSGMGLAICRKIAERHGGSIAVNSVKGEGSTFFISLPIEQ